MQNILEILYQGNNINQKQCETLIYNIINKQFSTVQITAALISMKIRGETVEEIVSTANTLLAHCNPFPIIKDTFADITGTGGDGKNTINISTASAIVAAACNKKIIKHGNYSISSISGSMDFLTHQDICAKDYENQALKNFNELGICFLCATRYYTVLQDIMPIRKQLKTPTLLNIVGPLINPARPSFTLIGVYKKALLLPIIQALKLLDFRHAIVVHCNGIDEIGLHAPTHVSELCNNIIHNYTLTPSDFGLKFYPIEDLYCDSQATAHKHIINLLKGKGKLSHTSVVAANVALLLKLFGHDNLYDNTMLALEKIYQGIPYTIFKSLFNPKSAL